MVISSSRNRLQARKHLNVLKTAGDIPKTSHYVEKFEGIARFGALVISKSCIVDPGMCRVTFSGRVLDAG